MSTFTQPEFVSVFLSDVWQKNVVPIFTKTKFSWNNFLQNGLQRETEKSCSLELFKCLLSLVGEAISIISYFSRANVKRRDNKQVHKRLNISRKMFSWNFFAICFTFAKRQTTSLKISTKFGSKSRVKIGSELCKIVFFSNEKQLWNIKFWGVFIFTVQCTMKSENHRDDLSSILYIWT